MSQVSPDKYVQLNISLSTLERLLAAHTLVASELHCPTPQAKAQLQQLLLKVTKTSR